MSWTDPPPKDIKTMRQDFIMGVLVFFLAASAFAADVRVPDRAVAGQAVAIGTSGSGSATLYVVGPGTAIKRQIQLGEEIQLKGEELRQAGYYLITLQGGGAAVN